MVLDPAEADAAEIRSRAIKLLARREHAPVELVYKLTARGYPAARVEAVVAALREQDLLSPGRFAESLARARADRGQGPLRIRAELSTKGIGEVDIDRALAAVEMDWNALAATVRRKRFGDEPPGDFPEKARQMRFLQRRGFTGEQIDAAFE